MNRLYRPGLHATAFLFAIGLSASQNSAWARPECRGLAGAIEETHQLANIKLTCAFANPGLDDESKARRLECVEDINPAYLRAVRDVNCAVDCPEEGIAEQVACSKINANYFRGQMEGLGVPPGDIDALRARFATGDLKDQDWIDYYEALAIKRKQVIADVQAGRDPGAGAETAAVSNRGQMPRSATPAPPSKGQMPTTEVCATHKALWKRVVQSAGLTCASKKPMHLTFDDGPTTATTPLALDTLREKGVQGTFFIMGERVEPHPNTCPANVPPPSPPRARECDGLSETMARARLRVVQRAIDEGHVIGSHSWYHRAHEKMAPNAIQNYAEKARSAGRKVDMDGQPMGEYLSGIYRMPEGSGISKSEFAFSSQGFSRHLFWDIDPHDYNHKSDGDATLEEFLQQACKKGGGVVLLHDIHPETVENLGKWIDALRCNGYQFADLETVIGEKVRRFGASGVTSGASRSVSDSVARPQEGEEARRRAIDAIRKDLGGGSSSGK
jgi:peptidoglycan/xylan/chitin deacetylase (PgdA/CDA1 family)